MRGKDLEELTLHSSRRLRPCPLQRVPSVAGKASASGWPRKKEWRINERIRRTRARSRSRCSGARSGSTASRRPSCEHGLAPHPPHGGVEGHARDERADSQGASPCRSGINHVFEQPASPEGREAPEEADRARPGLGQRQDGGPWHKGAKSRSGFQFKRGFEGGQMPLHRRVPKRGFHNPFRVEYEVVNLDQLAAKFEVGAIVTPGSAARDGTRARRRRPVKMLGARRDRQEADRARAQVQRQGGRRRSRRPAAWRKQSRS